MNDASLQYWRKWTFGSDSDCRIREVLRCEILDNDTLEEVFFSLTCARDSALQLEDYGSPSEIRDKLNVVYRNIERLKRSISALGVREIEALHDAIDEDEPGELARFDVSLADSSDRGRYGITLYELGQLLNLTSDAIENVDREIEIPRGPPIKKHPRTMAVEFKRVLEDHRIPVTSAPQGTYLTLLALAFEATFPSLGYDSYRGHGNWAIDNSGDE